MALSQEVHDAGQEVISATGVTLPSILNRILGNFLSWPFNATSGCVFDQDGNKTEIFASVVHAASGGGATPGTHDIHADNAAVVIDACEGLDLENFRASYERIAQAKRLKKSAAPSLEGTPITTITLGVIFALRSALPLEKLAEELERLNAQTPSQEWPDMVVVASTGTVNYVVQFPGESPSDDFLPPAERAVVTYTPPLYVVIVMRPTEAYTFNKMLAFMIAHLGIFSPGTKLPDWAQILEGVPKAAVTISAFQYNLSGDLLPVPRQFYNDRYLPPLPMRIEDQKGKLLCTLQFLPWQDGGTILLKGELPLDGLLVFLGKGTLQRAGVVNRPDLQISYVLPITQRDFNEMLTRIQRQSNVVVRGDQTKWVIQKIADEGSQSPFMARLFMGIMRLRDVVMPDPATRENFDTSYEIVFSSLLNVRTAAQEMVQLWQEHARKVTSGEVARLEGRTIHINENIDKKLKREVESFLNAAVRALKDGMQRFAREAQVNIGFLFQKQGEFDTGVTVLETRDPVLAEYLRQTRTWSERLLGSRNAIEHEGWMLPRVTYSHTGSTVTADEPSILGQPVSEFASFIFDRLACFVEELTAHCLQRQMPAGITITEIAVAQRLAEAPERFRVTLASGGLPAWQISYHHGAFEET